MRPHEGKALLLLVLVVFAVSGWLLLEAAGNAWADVRTAWEAGGS